MAGHMDWEGLDNGNRDKQKKEKKKPKKEKK